MSTTTLLGVGLYSIPEAARLLRATPRQVRRWALGYYHGTDSERRFSPPLISRQVSEADEEPVVTFQDLIGLKLVKYFRDEGVSMPMIRAAARRAAERYCTDHPFALRRFRTDGTTIFAELAERGVADLSGRQLTEDLRNGQMVMREVAVPFFHSVDYDADEPYRWWPLGKDRRVVIDPQRSFGRPIDASSGVPAFALHQMYRAGESVSNIARWYDVDPRAVEDAIAFEESLQQAA